VLHRLSQRPWTRLVGVLGQLLAGHPRVLAAHARVPQRLQTPVPSSHQVLEVEVVVDPRWHRHRCHLLPARVGLEELAGLAGRCGLWEHSRGKEATRGRHLVACISLCIGLVGGIRQLLLQGLG
jgi:hypothetical protein